MASLTRDQFTDPATNKYEALEALREMLRSLHRLEKNREVALSITKLEEAIMWLEKS